MAETGALARLSDGLSPAAAGLATELRTLFTGLDLSLTRYAARVHLDKSVISRYLSGERIPRWEFVHELLVHSTLKREGVAPTREVVSHLRSLHLTALENSNLSSHKAQLLQEQLAEADAQVQRAEQRERELALALQAAQYRAAESEVHSRELEDAADRRLDEHAAELAHYRDQVDVERSALLAEINRLMKELDLAHTRRMAAEARCADLERQLGQIPDEPEFRLQDRAAQAVAADTSSQLRTPLTALSMRMEEIIALADDPQTVRDEAEVALAQLDRLSDVVQRMLAGADPNRSSSLQKPIDVDPMIRQQVHEWRPAFQSSRRGIVVSGVRNLVALSTPGAFSQILSVLLENSLIHGAGTVTVHTRAVNGSVVVEVGDEGSGIPKELESRVFERSVSSRGATGLGLAVARELAESDGGQLDLVIARPAVFAVLLHEYSPSESTD